jgi:hypothetical protein
MLFPGDSRFMNDKKSGGVLLTNHQCKFGNGWTGNDGEHHVVQVQADTLDRYLSVQHTAK